MYHSISILLLTVLSLTVSSQSNPGHLKPFGTVGSLINIEETNGEYPNILKFFTYYIPKSEPILSRQVLNNDLHYDIWKTDEQLENEVEGLSKTNIHVESLKQQERIQMKFGDFLDKYQKEHLIFADNVPEILRKYLVVPSPLQCNSVVNTLQPAILIMSGINSSPLMLNENYDFFLCLLRGNQRLVLVNTHKYPDVRQIISPDNRQSRGPPVNPESVDLNRFPALANIDYHIANLTAGDCLFIPNGWIFQERSLDNTISVIHNIDHKRALKVDLNEVQTCATENSFDSSFTLDQIDWSSTDNQPQSLRDLIMSLVNSNSNNFEKWQETFSKHFSLDFVSDPEASALFDEFYNIIDVDGNGEVTMPEIEQIDGAHQHHISDILYEMVKLVSDKQKKEPEPKEIVQNEDYDDSDDEMLHLQNHKTDL